MVRMGQSCSIDFHIKFQVLNKLPSIKERIPIILMKVYDIH